MALTQIQKGMIADGAIDKSKLDAGNANGTGGIETPRGTTAQRPASPTVGMTRWNTDNAAMEYWNGSAWTTSFVLQYSSDYLLVAGGGGNAVGAGGNREGGNGAGGLLQGSKTIVAGTAYPIVIGAGGSGHANGSNSNVFDITTYGGGTGGNVDGMAGASGGSGGGGWYGGAGGAGTSGQGYAGSTSGGGNNWTGGGGGGSGGVGYVSGDTSVGGPGTSSSITGSAVTYAAGGPGNRYSGYTNNANGASNTGNGASGVGNGGSGIVVIRYLGAQKGTGGTVTSSGGYTIHTFTSSGTFTG
jgi:hypothetical protein